MQLARFRIALYCILIAACAPGGGPIWRPGTHRWRFAGTGSMGLRMEFDGATMEVQGPIARVWMRSFRPNDPEPVHIYQEEFDCVRGKRRTLFESMRWTGNEMGPLKVASGGPNPGWKDGMWVPNGGPGNAWGRTLLYVCRAAGMPELSTDSVLPEAP